jgi:hypothetical protein
VPVVVYVVWSAALLSRREYAFAEGWTGLRIRNLDGQPLPLGRAVLRQALQVSWLCLLWVLSLMAMIAIAPSGPYGFDGVWMLFWAAAWAACAAGITATNAKHRHLYDVASGAYPFTSEAQVLPDMAGRAAGGRVKGAIGVLISAVAWALGASVSFASLGLTTSSEHGGAAWLCGVIGGAGAAIGLEMTSASPSARTRSWLAGGWTVAMTLCGMVLRANSYYTGYYSYSIAGYRINSDAVLAAGLVGGLVGGVATAIALRPGGSYRRFAAAAIWAMAIGLVPSMCAALTQDFAPFVGTVIGPAVAGAIGQGATLWVFKGTRTEITPKVNA